MAAPDRTRRLAVACVAALAALSVAWELWLAPLRPGGSLLALKALPLAVALPAIARGRVRVYQWWSMLMLVYVAEGAVRALSDPGTHGRMLGVLALVLSLAAWFAIVAHVRAVRFASAEGSPAATAGGTAGGTA
jgi:uncharacterized membrane protein